VFIKMDSQDLRNLTEAWQNITSQDIDEGILDDPRWGALGQLSRTGVKMFGSNKDIENVRRIEKSGLLDRFGYKSSPRDNTSSKVEPTRERETSSPVRNGSPVRSAPAVSPQQAARNKANAEYQALRTKDPAAAKAKGMEIFAKANPKLAAAAAERARTRGTSATTNPLMADLKSRLPAPAPIAAAPAVAATAPITNRTAMAYGSGATPVTPIRPIVPVARPVAQTPVARPITPIAYRPGLRLQHTDLFDIVKGHLMNEGATEKEALKRMVNMTEEERQDIIEAKYGTKEGRKKLAKKIRKGEEIGKSGPGTGFAAVEKAAKEGGARDPKAVAAAVMWKTHGGKK
jgi:hypothetical protein